jgi:hypothetical protein
VDQGDSSKNVYKCFGGLVMDKRGIEQCHLVYDINGWNYVHDCIFH